MPLAISTCDVVGPDVVDVLQYWNAKVAGLHRRHERLAIVDPSQSRHPPFSRTAFRRATLARDPQRVAPFCSCCPHTVLLASGANHTPCLRGRPFLSHQWLSATDPPVPVLVGEAPLPELEEPTRGSEGLRRIEEKFRVGRAGAADDWPPQRKPRLVAGRSSFVCV